MKTCTKCKTDYSEPLTDHFALKNTAKDGLQFVCKVCNRTVRKEHYTNNKQYYKNKATIHNENYRIRGLQHIVDYLKEHPCIDCGEPDTVVLEFDHRENKICSVSKLTESNLDVINAEIAKCDVRCANCHRRKTAIQLGWYRGIKL